MILLKTVVNNWLLVY